MFSLLHLILPSLLALHSFKTFAGHWHSHIPLCIAVLDVVKFLALEWSDIDFINRIIKVSKSLYFKGNAPVIKEPKSKAGCREVPMPVNVLKLLCKANKSTDRVVSSATGKTLTSIAFRRLWEIVINKLQKPIEKKEEETSKSEVEKPTDKEKRVNMLFEVTPHKLRHTYCTSLHSAGIDLKTAQYLMGHSNIAITAEIYTHIEKAHILSASEKIRFILFVIISSKHLTNPLK